MGRYRGEGSSPSESNKLRKQLSKLDRRLTNLGFQILETPRGLTRWFNLHKEIRRLDELRKITRLRLKGYDV